MIRTLLCLIALSACTLTTASEEADPNRLDWLTGCWQGDDGMTREVWSGSEDGYYFGYSIVLKDGHAVFFEQMRVDPAPLPVFNAYPAGDGPSAFPATEISDTSVTFANPAHDFPQKIKYWRDGTRLRATISRIDDSRAAEFSFTRCAER
ncbi:MAG: hypothetical protein HRT82_04785 [Henriciella sp.]|nr:hypothetical protein [Henriciella sp.]